MAITGAIRKEIIVAILTNIPKSPVPSNDHINKNVPKMRRPINRGYRDLEIFDSLFFIIIGNRSSELLFNARPYPSNTAIQVPNIIEKVAAAIKTGDRENVIAVVLGRGATDEKVNEWLRAGSSVEGYKGFAIGRSIFWDALKGFHEGDKSREEAVTEIAESYLGFLSVYQNGS